MTIIFTFNDWFVIHFICDEFSRINNCVLRSFPSSLRTRIISQLIAAYSKYKVCCILAASAMAHECLSRGDWWCIYRVDAVLTVILPQRDPCAVHMASVVGSWLMPFVGCRLIRVVGMRWGEVSSVSRCICIVYYCHTMHQPHCSVMLSIFIIRAIVKPTIVYRVFPS